MSLRGIKLCKQLGVCAALFFASGSVGRADVGPVPALPPSYSAADYAAYESPGTIAFHAHFLLPDFKYALPGVQLWAIPDFPYTRWFVARSA
jgi:hypothetical protein